MLIRKMDMDDAIQVAGIHIQEISTGFISSLGPDFVKALYDGIAKSQFGFGYVCEENSEIIGFISASCDVGKLYKELVLKRGVLFAIKLLRHILSWRKARNILQTLFYPSKTKNTEVKAEILSVAVCAKYQGIEIGKRLMETSLQDFRKKGTKQVSVSVSVQNNSGNRFYQSCGFKLVTKVKHHDNYLNVYVIDI